MRAQSRLVGNLKSGSKSDIIKPTSTFLSANVLVHVYIVRRATLLHILASSAVINLKDIG